MRCNFGMIMICYHDKEVGFMNNCPGRMLKLLQLHGISYGMLAAYTGIPKSALQRYATGKTKTIPPDRAAKVAAALHTTPGYLLGWEMPDTSAGDRALSALLADYAHLSPAGRQEACKRVHELTQLAKYCAHMDQTDYITLDYYLLPTSAGTGLYLFDETRTAIHVAATSASRQADFVLPVRGDSMEPQFSDGDMILVKSAPVITVGQTGVFIYNGCAYIKALGDGCLLSHNPAYPPIRIDDSDTIYCMGLVLGKAHTVQEDADKAGF